MSSVGKRLADAQVRALDKQEGVSVRTIYEFGDYITITDQVIECETALAAYEALIPTETSKDDLVIEGKDGDLIIPTPSSLEIRADNDVVNITIDGPIGAQRYRYHCGCVISESGDAKVTLNCKKHSPTDATKP